MSWALKGIPDRGKKRVNLTLKTALIRPDPPTLSDRRDLEGSFSTAPVLVLIAWVCLFCFGLGCHDEADNRPNVLIVLVDTLRADHTSLYGYSKPTTPHLEEIAAEGWVLRSHLTTAPWTKPAVASLITGLHPTAHGSRLGQFDQIDSLRQAGKAPKIETLSDQHVTLAERFRDTGYRTAAFVANYHLTPRFGYDQGYEHYHFDPNRYRWDSLPNEVVKLSDAQIITSAMEYLSAESRPAFVWCHLMSVHDYTYPSDFSASDFLSESETPIDPSSYQYRRVDRYKTIEEAVAEYDTSISYVDHLIGRLFSYLVEEEPNTLLIVTSDHGEEFFEHGGFEHVYTLYNEQLRVPLLAWGPGIPTGNQIFPTSAVDVVPTLIDMLDLSPDPHLLGSNFFAADPESLEDREIFAEMHHRGPAKRFALFLPDKKIILNERKSDLKKNIEIYEDPLAIERANISGEVSESMISGYEERIQSWRDTTRLQLKTRVGSGTETELEDVDIEGLKALGYIQ